MPRAVGPRQTSLIPKPLLAESPNQVCLLLTDRMQTTTSKISTHISSYLVLFSHSQLIMSRRLVPSPFTLNRFAVVQVRYNSTVGTGARGSVIDTQHVPAPGAGHIKVLLLNRPEARNAISRELLDSLTKHVNSIDAEKGKGPTRALVLASNIDAAFCAGADLKERAKFTREE